MKQMVKLATGYGGTCGLIVALAACVAGPTDSTQSNPGDGEGSIDEAGQALTTTAGSVAQGQYAQYSFTKSAGWRYTICIDVTQGDADLYGHYTGYPTKTNYQYSSTNTGKTSDCITFPSTSAGTYYISVYGYAAGTSTFTYRRSSSDNTTIPSYLSGQLKRPNACTTPIATFGSFNAPWGNPSFSPFYNFSQWGGAYYKNYIHNGVDYACGAATQVKAVCTGTVTKVGDLGGDPYNGTSSWWGKYVIQECAVGTQKVTIAYDHLDSIGTNAHTPNGSPPQTVGATLTKGVTVVGTIVHLTLPGEADHLHLGVCAGPASSCSGLQSGASPDTSFPPPLFLNADASGLWGP